jgi:hypothetical protein
MHYKPVSRQHCSCRDYNTIAAIRLYYWSSHLSRRRDCGRSNRYHDSEQGRCQYGSCASWRVSCCCAWYYSILIKLWYWKPYSALFADATRDGETSSKFIFSIVRPWIYGLVNYVAEMASVRYHLI